MTAEQISTAKYCCRATIRNSLLRYSIQPPKGFWVRVGKKIGRPIGIPMSSSQKEFRSNHMRGEGNPFYGKRHSMETRKKMRQNHADFRGDKNPFKKSLENPENLEKLRQRSKIYWANLSEQERLEHGKKTRTGFEGISGTFWARVKSNAKARNLLLSISPEEAWKIFLQQDRKCALSGVELQFGHSWFDTTASLDRIDSSGNYTPFNVCWVHKTINIMKNVLPIELFIEWCQKVAGHSEANYGKDISPFVE